VKNQQKSNIWPQEGSCCFIACPCPTHPTLTLGYLLIHGGQWNSNFLLEAIDLIFCIIVGFHFLKGANKCEKINK